MIEEPPTAPTLGPDLAPLVPDVTFWPPLPQGDGDDDEDSRIKKTLKRILKRGCPGACS